MTNENLMPKIRFKGFSDPWEQRKFSDLGRLGRGKSKHRPRNDKVLFGGKYPFIQTGNISAASTYITGYSQTLNEIGILQSKLWEKGTLVITIAANVADSAILGIKAAFPDSIIGFTTSEFNILFIKYQLDSKSLFLKNRAETSSQANLNLDKLSNLMFTTPLMTEQTRISYILLKADNLIAANEEKVSELKTLKKLLMQRIFDQSWRFKGFTDSWEQRKFSKLYKKNNERNKGKFGVDKTISIANMYFKEKGNGAADTSIDAYKVLRVGDIAFEGHESKKFSYGRMVMNDIGDGIMSPRFTTLRPIKKQIVTFWKILIHYEPIMKHILVRSTKKGTMMNELVMDDFMKNSINTPDKSEQIRIGQVFRILDEVIAANEEKCEQLKQLKKYLMQNMFV